MSTLAFLGGLLLLSLFLAMLGAMALSPALERIEGPARTGGLSGEDGQ